MWRRLASVLGLVAAGIIAHDAAAQTLQETMAAAYETNAALSAERARLRATDERVPQALSGYRPTVTGFVRTGRRWLDSNRESLVGDTNDALFERSMGATIQQPLWRGGQTAAAVRGAENSVLAERARLDSAEQKVLLDAATAYSNVYRDQAVLELRIQNEQRLARELQATRDRFQVGEVTRTDVSQAEARLARATAERTGAEGTLAGSRANFRNVVGRSPELLGRPPLPERLPPSLEDVNRMASDWYPDVAAAGYDERSALDAVDQVRGELSPTVSLVGRIQRDLDVDYRDARYDSMEALVDVQVPLYQAGSVYSRLRAQKQTVAERRRRVDQAERDAVESATRSWNNLQTAGSEIVSFRKQVEANQFALEGVQREAEVGARTVLDVLDAQQELSDSQVSLVQAEANQVTAAYQLKSAIGDLTARKLDLPVAYYNPNEHYREVRGAWFGGSASGDISDDFDGQLPQR